MKTPSLLPWIGKAQYPVIAYVCEEVRRQGHDLLHLDGIERVGWMLDAWSYALIDAGARRAPTIEAALDIGRHIEPDKNRMGWRRCGVRVGDRICPDWQKVPYLLARLFDARELKPLEFYKEFELIHPFVNGNGRTGKVLLNWMNGTLLLPVFPPKDRRPEPRAAGQADRPPGAEVRSVAHCGKARGLQPGRADPAGHGCPD